MWYLYFLSWQLQHDDFLYKSTKYKYKYKQFKYYYRQKCNMGFLSKIVPTQTENAKLLDLAGLDSVGWNEYTTKGWDVFKGDNQVQPSLIDFVLMNSKQFKPFQNQPKLKKWQFWQFIKSWVCNDISAPPCSIFWIFSNDDAVWYDNVIMIINYIQRLDISEIRKR